MGNPLGTPRQEINLPYLGAKGIITRDWIVYMWAEKTQTLSPHLTMPPPTPGMRKPMPCDPNDDRQQTPGERTIIVSEILAAAMVHIRSPI